jgi:hypothetical protein
MVKGNMNNTAGYNKELEGYVKYDNPRSFFL